MAPSLVAPSFMDPLGLAAPPSPPAGLLALAGRAGRRAAAPVPTMGLLLLLVGVVVVPPMSSHLSSSPSPPQPSAAAVPAGDSWVLAGGLRMLLAAGRDGPLPEMGRVLRPANRCRACRHVPPHRNHWLL